VGAVQSLAKYYDLIFSTRDAQLPASNPESEKYSWTLEETAKFVGLMKSPLYRSLAVFLLQSGIDCRTALELNYGKIKSEYEAEIVPLCIRTERFKTGIPFLTFIGTWGVKTLKEHLNHCGKLSEDTPLFPISEQSVDAYFRRCAKKFLNKDLIDIRNPCSPHSLRAAFSTFCRDNLRGEDKASEIYVEYWMGKNVPEEKRVYITKTVESWRKTWRERAEPFLTPQSIKASW
jgi:integrase